MIESFEIQNFRLFKNLKIDKLARVNLITGKNNVGKTTLLEAMCLYSTKGLVNSIKTILYYREQYLSNMHFYLINFYNNFNFSNSISFGPISKQDRLNIQVISLTEEWDESRSHMKRRFTPIQNGLLPNQSVGIKVEYNEQMIDLIPIYSQFPLIKNEIIDEYIVDRGISTCCYIPPQGIPTLASLWDMIVLSEKEDIIVSSLNKFFPGIEGIRSVNHPERKDERQFVIKIKNKKPFPISIMGDGILKILNIVIPMANSSGGILLLDEIENGIHYSIQKTLWEIILDLAEQFNVQVFATTHSWDCIDGFQQALNAFHDPSQGQLLRLSKQNDDIISTSLDARELAIATRENIEVR